LNREINRKFREIRGKCNDKTPKHYPSYCHRAVLDILGLLNQIREETASTQNQIDNLTFLDTFAQTEEALPR